MTPRLFQRVISALLCVSALLAIAGAQEDDGTDGLLTTSPVSPQEYPELWKNIAQSDDLELRQRTLDHVYGALLRADEEERRAAMGALTETTQVAFDRERFLPIVREALTDESPTMKAFALRIIRRFGGDASDLTEVAALAEDEERYVRAGVIFALYQLDPQGRNELVEPAILRLLADENPMVLTESCRNLWSRPTTPAIESALVELSRDPEKQSTIVYYALSTRPLLRKDVAERLIELAEDAEETPLETRERASWGLSHSRPDEEARPLALEAMTRWISSGAPPAIRANAVWGTAQHGGVEYAEVLRLAARDTDPDVQREAVRALKRLEAEVAPVPES